MPGRNLCCIASSEAQASEIASQLKLSGFSSNDISALLPDKTGSRDFGHERRSKAPTGAISGVCVGGIIGAALGWLAGIGTLALPGLGPLVAAGPILAALSGAAVLAACGGILGALGGGRRAQYVAQRYDGKLADGDILISVHAEDRRALDKAWSIIERCGARDIALCGEARTRPPATA